MEKQPWQHRLRAAGLTQVELANLLGLRPNSVSDALRGNLKGGVPRYLQAFIIAWEVMGEEQRAQCLRQVDESRGAR